MCFLYKILKCTMTAFRETIQVEYMWPTIHIASSSKMLVHKNMKIIFMYRFILLLRH